MKECALGIFWLRLTPCLTLTDPVTGSSEMDSLSLLLGWESDQGAVEWEPTSVDCSSTVYISEWSCEIQGSEKEECTSRGWVNLKDFKSKLLTLTSDLALRGIIFYGSIIHHLIIFTWLVIFYCTALTAAPWGYCRWWDQLFSARYSVSIKVKLPEKNPDSPPAVWHIFSSPCWRPSLPEASSSFSLISLSLLWFGYRKNLEITSRTGSHTLYVDILLPLLPLCTALLKISEKICIQTPKSITVLLGDL